MTLIVHGFTQSGSIEISLGGQPMGVPDDPENRHRQMIAEWEAQGNTIAGFVGPSDAPLWEQLRTERDRLIAATDWMVLRNLETSEPVSPAWLAYRQALRDLPTTTADPGNPDWPEQPDLAS